MHSGMFHATLLVLLGAVLPLGLCGGKFEKPFGCQKVTMNDQIRQEVLNLINGIRSRVALGEWTNGKARNFLSPASDMVKLSWDCNLERMAQTVVSKCRKNPSPPVVPNGMNYHFFGPDASAFILSNSIEFAVRKWAEINDLIWPANNIFNGNRSLRSFANMIRASTTSVGCSSSICGDRTAAAAACFFTSPTPRTGALVYTAGYPCRNDGQCTRFSPAFCEAGLCVRATRPSTTTSPSTTPSATPVTISATTPTTKAIMTTKSGRSTDCPSTAFSAEFRETALGMHNSFRSVVARGLANNAVYANGTAPPSSRMNLLKYDCNAEQFALTHVKSCDRKLSPPTSHPGYLENIHISEQTQTDQQGAMENAVMAWNRELATNGLPLNMVLTPQVLQRKQKTVTNVTKVIWGTNKNVGCATQLCSGFYFTSCMYQEPVNVVRQSIYRIGAVCDACPGGFYSCTSAVGLCSS